MMHVIISDTHSPRCIDKALSKVKKILVEYPDIDSLVVNGDLLGIFSMSSSSIHKNSGITQAQINEYFESVCNKFAKKKTLTKDEVLEYVEERYKFCVDKLREFSKLKHTIFNLGNHESKHHFLVLQELDFFGVKYEKPEQKELENIFESFEKKLYALEKELEFNYIKDKHHVKNGVLMLGIPGLNHASEGSDDLSKLQEEKTLKLIEAAKKDLNKIHSIIIYNHTQGNYNNGEFRTASKSLAKFMSELPNNVRQKIYVQSHNHWAHTQFLKDDFHYILNNAGLHDGIFNLVNFNSLGVECYDIDPNADNIIKLKLADNKENSDVIGRNYPNPEIVNLRKGKNKVAKKLNSSEVDELRKRIFGK